MINLLQLQQSLTLQVLSNLLDALLHTLQVAPDVNLRLLRCLIRRTDASELWNLALARLLVQALGVARLRDFKRDINEDLNERKRLVGAGRHSVQIASCRAVGFVRGDEGCDCDCGAVGKEFGDLVCKSVIGLADAGRNCVIKPRDLRHAWGP